MELHSKQDFVNLAHQFLNPLLPLYSEEGARLPLGGAGATYDKNAIEMESFSRPLWALVPLWAGGRNHKQFEEIYERGLANGANPTSSEYWGGFHDYDQLFVEMAAIACGLLLAPRKLWKPLSADEKARLADWLGAINRYVIPKCNWQFFRVLVNLALKKQGMPYSEEKLNESLAEIDEYYIGGGWYRDGASGQKDYYVPFAMHYYGLVYAKVMELDDPERGAKFKDRAAEFAKDFIYWFAGDGAALPFGRSLTYRFAQVSFWSACLFAGIKPFSIEVMKGIIVRHFEYWLNQEIFDRDNILAIGYAYPNLIMAERYNAPGSPYWSMKSFLMLALPDNHPFWSAQPAPLPQLEEIRPLPFADMIIQRRDNDVVGYAAGVCELYGHGHIAEKYSKFAYSTAFGFSVMRSSFVLNEACPDSMLAFVIDDTVFVRKNSIKWRILNNSVYSEWSPFTGIHVKTTITLTKDGHKRRHEIISDYDCYAIDYGFSVPRFAEGCIQALTEKEAVLKAGRYRCAVQGNGPDATPEILHANPNTNLLFTNTSIPGIKYRIHKGITAVETIVVSETGEA